MRGHGISRGHLVALLLVSGLFAATPARAGTTHESRSVLARRLPLLTRGINVGWLNNPTFTLDRPVAEREAALIRATGCRHIRLFLNVHALEDPADSARPNPEKLPALDAAIRIALQHDLAVIVDPFHYGAHGAFVFPRPGTPGAERMVQFWAVLARHLARFDPDRVFLEAANEPKLPYPREWYVTEVRLLKVMRRNAPNDTLIAGYNLRASPNDWDGIKALTYFPVVADPDVVYDFHFYEPLTFTHQGAGWARIPAVRKLHGVPYPSSPSVIRPLLAEFTTPAEQAVLRRYGQQHWDRRTIFRRIDVAARWAAEHHVHLICDEFGVYGAFAPPAARVAWIHDVRVTLEKLGIGWTIWNGSFGFLERKDGHFHLDVPVLHALGLQVPPKPAAK